MLIPLEIYEKHQRLFSIDERLNFHNNRFSAATGRSPDYYRETAGWNIGGESTFSCPYGSLENLWQMQALGNELGDNPTALAIIENLISYTVGEGFEWSVLGGSTGGRRMIDDCIREFEDDHGWCETMAELVRDYWRIGDGILRFVPTNGELDIEFVESHELRPRQGEQQLRTPDGEYGINFEGRRLNTRTGLIEPGNANRPVEYIIRGEAVPSDQVCHLKHGVGRRAPRGVPLLWNVYCQLKEIEELDYAITQVGITFGEHAIVYLYDKDTSTRSIYDIQDSVANMRTDAIEEGLPNAGGTVHHARGHTIETIVKSFGAGDWCKIIQLKQAKAALVAGVPRWMATNEFIPGGIGGSSAFEMESPFIIRTGRYKKQFRRFLKCILEYKIAHKIGQLDGRGRFRDGWLKQFRAQYQYTPKFAELHTQDKTKRDELVLKRCEKRLINPQAAMEHFGDDYESVMAGWRAHQEQLAELGEDINVHTPAELRNLCDLFQKLVGAGNDRSWAAEYLGLPLEFANQTMEQEQGQQQQQGRQFLAA